MAKPSTRQELIDYCKRQLGAPVLQINIDDDQLEDRIDDAFQFYREYHYDAVELIYLKHEITTENLANGYIELNDNIVGVNKIFPFTNKTTGNNLFSLQYQILIYITDDGEFISIIDGHHRAQKAVRKGLETIKAKVIPINSLPKKIRRVFSHMN